MSNLSRSPYVMSGLPCLQVQNRPRRLGPATRGLHAATVKLGSRRVRAEPREIAIEKRPDQVGEGVSRQPRSCAALHTGRGRGRSVAKARRLRTRIASFTPRAFAAASAAFVRWLIAS